MNWAPFTRLLGPFALMASSIAGADEAGEPFSFAPLSNGHTTTTGFLDLRSDVGLGSGDKKSGAGSLKTDVDSGYRGRGRFELTHQMETTRLVLSGDAQLERERMRGGPDHNEQTARVWESYLEIDGEKLSWRIGRQVIQWGVADEVSVIDSFTPQDFRSFLVQSRFERKWPVTAVSSRYFLSGEDFVEVVWLPEFREDLLARPGEEWSLFVENNYVRGLGLRERSSATQNGRLGDSVFAVRSMTRRETFDFSLNYAYHFEQLAAFEADIEGVEPDGKMLGTVQPYHARQQTASMAFETGREGIGLRGELAYVTDSGYVSYDMNVPGLVERRDTVRGVAGIDYTFASRTYINVQYTLDYIKNHNSMMQPDKFRPSVTWRVNTPLVGEDLWLEFQGREFFNMTDRFWRLQLRWRVTDDWELRGGGLHLAGADEGIFGQFRDNDQVYVGAHYYF
ncbi:hypothetical protein POF45_02040 [Pseudomonas sp. 681]|uniref:Porin n=1 Tax=Pseudomonas fungipugnans TaxID=3024217 RepID=A0ABT6QH47_9PSED|nr:DUF1302 family protein [Pseudomonas sp. 681]MDI2590212.1 hypothetical protein [Pseudomonas sp. 681]